MSASGIGFLGAALVASVVLGWWRGLKMPLWRGTDGGVLRKGDRAVLVLWLVTVAVRLALAVTEHALFRAPFNVDAIWLGMGVTLACQHAVMTRRGALLPLREEHPPRAAREPTSA